MNELVSQVTGDCVTTHLYSPRGNPVAQGPFSHMHCLPSGSFESYKGDGGHSTLGPETRALPNHCRWLRYEAEEVPGGSPSKYPAPPFVYSKHNESNSTPFDHVINDIGTSAPMTFCEPKKSICLVYSAFGNPELVFKLSLT